MNSDENLVDVVVSAVLTTSVCAVTLIRVCISVSGRSVTGTVDSRPAVISTSMVILPIPGKDTSSVYPFPGGRGTMRNSPFVSVTAPWETPRVGFFTETVAAGKGLPSLSTIVPFSPALDWAPRGGIVENQIKPAASATTSDFLAFIGSTSGLAPGAQPPSTGH